MLLMFEVSFHRDNRLLRHCYCIRFSHCWTCCLHHLHLPGMNHWRRYQAHSNMIESDFCLLAASRTAATWVLQKYTHGPFPKPPTTALVFPSASSTRMPNTTQPNPTQPNAMQSLQQTRY